MKIRMTVTIEMTPEQAYWWSREYDVDKENLREDVKRYVHTGLTGHGDEKWESVTIK